MAVNDFGLVFLEGAIELPQDRWDVSRTDNFDVKPFGLQSFAESATSKMSEDERIMSLLALPSAELSNDGFGSADFHAVNDVCNFH